MVASPTTGLRERKNQRTVGAIVRAAAELTIEHGYAHATIPRIAERADVAPRTVSTWFPAKDDILLGGDDDRIARGIGHLADGTGDVVDRLAAWFVDEGSRQQRDVELWGLRLRAIDHDPDLRARDLRAFGALADAVADAVARDIGGTASELGPQMVAGAALALLRSLRSYSLTRTIEEMGPLSAAGLDGLRAVLAAVTDATR